MKYCWLLWILMFSAYSIAQAQDDADIYWVSQTQLSLSNFNKDTVSKRKERKLGADRHHVLQGFIFTGIRFQFEQIGDHIEYSVKAYMNPDESWLRNKEDFQTLLHEQGHFNITEMYARKIRKELSRIDDPLKGKKIYRELFDELLKVQKQFDAENKDESGVSEFWRNKITNELKFYSDFTSTTVTIN